MTRQSPPFCYQVATAALFVSLLLSGAQAGAQLDAGDGTHHDSGLDPSDAAVSAQPNADELRGSRVRALIDGTLSPSIDPQSLFDVPLGDELELQVAAARIRALSRELALQPEGSHALERVLPGRARQLVSAARGKLLADAAVDADRALMESEVGRARLALDGARLEFYLLPLATRSQLLTDHEARREAALPKESEVQRATREAERERERALEAARAARSEGERLVAEELARLIDLQRALTVTQARLGDERASLSARRDSVLGWQRRVRDAKAGTCADADDTYDALRRALRSARDDLASALEQLGASGSSVPELGPNRLTEIRSDIATTQVTRRRADVEKQYRTALAQERALREERAAILLEETLALNRERLGLLSKLSSQKRTAITGWTTAGADQARSEARHLLLILRYHRHVAAGWLGRVRGEGKLEDASIWHVAATTVPWLLVVASFVWARRRTTGLLSELEQRLAEQDRGEHRVSPSPGRLAVRFVQGVHRPVEWLALFWVLLWLLPTGAQDLLEVQLLSVIIGWSLAGSLVVDIINSLATVTTSATTRTTEATNRLRLESLRLVGRVVVLFALVLLLSARLVGEGTVYSWVASTCWFAAIPVFLLLVRWWRDTVFIRIERIRRKSELQAWVLANREGWKSFFAAMIAAVQLFSAGAFKIVRNWLAGFELTRRADAYLFKRGLDRLADERTSTPAKPLNDAMLASLSPDRAGQTWVATSSDDQLEALLERCASGQGGVLALVAPLGMGKSALLARLAGRVPGSVTMSCTSSTDATSIRAALDNRASDAQPLAAMLLDDAQVLVKPIMNGLRAFDEVLTLARSAASFVTWVFVLDDVVWPFLQRARDARPSFDEVVKLEPWADEEIGKLLMQRSQEAGFTPTFEDLLEKLPPSADEIDRQEALTAKRTGYVRVVWDYARGNPALALDVWRRSLVQDAAGNIRARPLRAPQSAQLERLPDSALFILRAILQLTPASYSDVVQVTRLTENQVRDAVEFGKARGYLSQRDGRVEVTWTWRRLVLLQLERRHLLEIA